MNTFYQSKELTLMTFQNRAKSNECRGFRFRVLVASR
jgi:hypothetical protein